MHTQKITNVNRTGTWQKSSEESRSELFVKLVCTGLGDTVQLY